MSQRYGPATELLAAELPDQRFETADYLPWLYDSNPLGPSFVAESTEDGVLAGHYGLVRQTYRDPVGLASFVFSLNAVTRSGSQRKGTFSKLGRQVWDEARSEGVLAVVGVTNDKSVIPVARQGWRLLCRLPVLMLAALPVPARKGFESTTAAAVFEAGGGEQRRWLSGWDSAPVRRWANMWSPKLAAWRLGWPGCGPYALHSDGNVLAVSTSTVTAGVRVTVILKLVALQPVALDAKARSGQAAVSAACAHHRTAAAVYAGFNRSVSVRGWPLPDRFRPAPLNLMVHSLDPAVPASTFALDTFELLDMDAF